MFLVQGSFRVLPHRAAEIGAQSVREAHFPALSLASARCSAAHLGQFGIGLACVLLAVPCGGAAKTNAKSPSRRPSTSIRSSTCLGTAGSVGMILTFARPARRSGRRA